MTYAIRATTERGNQLVLQAEELAAEFSQDAARYDHDASFPYAHLETLKRERLLYSPVPKGIGGLGIESPHDVFVASSRLARGDASLMLGVNMHLVILLSLARQRQIACNRGDLRRVEAVDAMLAQFVRDESVLAAAVSEPNQDLTRQSTRAVCDSSGWTLTGRKIVTSMAPAATHFSVSLGYADREGCERYAYAIVPRTLPGITVHDDWDGLGMRSSASSTVTFENCPLPTPPGRGAPAGRLSPEYLESTLLSGAAHASSSIGIAEAAAQSAADAAGAKRGARPTARHLAAELAIDLAASRAIFARSLLLIEEYYADHPVGLGSLEEANGIFAEVQQAKTFVNQATVRIVDKAMTIVGGAAYSNKHPLSRLYRDARAGAFMHPLGANVSFEYLGAMALGLSPETL